MQYAWRSGINELLCKGFFEEALDIDRDSISLVMEECIPTVNID
jgi:hypothetical protein